MEVFGAGGGSVQGSLYQRQQALDMIARSQFRHHAPEYAVQVHLAPQLVRQQATLLVQYRNGALIAGGLYGKHSHGRFKYDPWPGPRRARKRPVFAFCRQPL